MLINPAKQEAHLGNLADRSSRSFAVLCFSAGRQAAADRIPPRNRKSEKGGGDLAERNDREGVEREWERWESFLICRGFENCNFRLVRGFISAYIRAAELAGSPIKPAGVARLTDPCAHLHSQTRGPAPGGADMSVGVG
jgi:hypothetical protein